MLNFMCIKLKIINIDTSLYGHKQRIVNFQKRLSNFMGIKRIEIGNEFYFLALN